MASPICLFCGSYLPAQLTTCRQTALCRKSAVAAIVNEVKFSILSKSMRYARHCVSTNIPPDGVLFDFVLNSIMYLGATNIALAMDTSADMVERWATGKCRPPPIDQLKLLSYAISEMESYEL